jgi:uncharacterized protein
MIHVAITRTVRPGCEQEFEEEVAKLSLEVEREPGVEGAYLLRPAEEGSRDYGILRAFSSKAACDRFYRSAPYERWNQSIAPLVEGPPRRRDVRGIEGFFVTPSAGGPPAWKMALITWLAVNPAVFVSIRIVKAVLGPQPELVELLVGNTLVITLLTWVLMPALTRIFARWLRTPPPEGATADRVPA